MFSLSRFVVRVAVVGALAVGGLAVIAGPARIKALFSQTRDSINSKIDQMITDPVALRQQLRELEGQYPRKIAQVRSDLAEVRSQLSQLQREQQVSVRVVELADRDSGVLKQLVADGEATVMTMNASGGAPRRVELVFDGRSLSLEDAYAKVNDVLNIRAAYAARLDDIDRDLGHLVKQEERLAQLLTRLESERAEFQVQLWQLDRQVDSIARNDRMIDVLTKRQAAIDEHSRYQAGSLDQLHGRVADIRARQEAELAALSAGQDRTDYETKARQTLDRDASRQPVKPQTRTAKGADDPDVVRIHAKPAAAPAPKGPTAGPQGTPAKPEADQPKPVAAKP